MSKPAHIPPSFSLKIIRKLCKPELVEEIEGNLYECFFQLKEERKKTAGFRYWFEVMNYLRPSMLKSFKKSKSQGNMFVFNPKLAIRSLLKHRATTFISLAGFVVGLLSVIFLYFYIENELNYDAFHTDKDKIYRVKRLSSNNGDGYSIGVTSGPYAPALINDYPSTITDVCRVYPQEALISVGEKKIYEEKLIFADSNFFAFFTYPLLVGDPKTVLSNVNTVVISKAVARKYFEGEDPIGQFIEVDNEYRFTVTGIMDDYPNKSHLDFNMVFNLALFNDFKWFHGWWNNGLLTYSKVNTPLEAEYLNGQLHQFMDKYFGEDFKKSGRIMGLTLEPLADIHFNHDTKYDEAIHGNRTNVMILGFVAMAILFIACFNYINLSIAQSHKRAKEVGIKKVLGAHRSRLILQFLGESILLLTLAVGLSLTLAELLLPKFNDYFSLDVSFNWFNRTVMLFFLGLFLTVILSSVLYPALLLSSFQPIKILKGGKVTLGKSLLVRKGLVIAQFAISIFLIISTILISSQINFMKTKSLGYDKSAILIIDNNNAEIRNKKKSFIESLKNHPNIIHAGSSSGAPGGYHDGTTIQIAGVDKSIAIRTVFADPEYLKIFDIPVVAGRGFDSQLTSEIDYAMMINESALDELGLDPESVIGKKTKLPGWNMERTIVGIYKDYHFLDLKNQIAPQGIMMGDFHRRILIKMNGNNVSQTLSDIEDLFKKFSPNYPISYWFQDDKLASHYIIEETQVRVFIMFAVVSIFLACLGIFGLASYSAQQRQKELGIRKVLGASVAQIITLISKEFMILVTVACVMAIPLCWYFMDAWLMDFAYRINLGANWLTFITGGLMAFLIAFITISLKTYRAAASNPSKSIRCE